MKFFKKLKSSNFWVSMISAVVLILQAVFNVDIKTEYLSQIIMAMLGVLVMTGIVSDSSSSEAQNKQDVNLDNITQSLGKIFTQTIANIETNILSVVTQFEKFKESFNGREDKSVEQNVQVNESLVQTEKTSNITEQNLPTTTEGVEQNLQTKVENVEEVNNQSESLAPAQVVENFIEIKQGEQCVNPTSFEQHDIANEVKTSNLNVL